jgi:hypothetical protein
MSKKALRFLALMLIAFTPFAQAESPEVEGREVAISISDAIPFLDSASSELGVASPKTFMRRQIEDTCGLGRALSEAVVSSARRKKILVVPTADITEAQGKVLVIAIEGARGQIGGAMSGTKSLTVRGELREGDAVLGSFVARRQQTALAAGTCKSLIKCARQISKDIAKWLKNPVPKARLGSA